eukprot:GHVH01011145.1.p1 GENE.GHVH01011145.1~~GHVH01011145.1.p1  ORF type:complete len:609 (+),score=35.88 GHVH01011145.1:228-2054(+)
MTRKDKLKRHGHEWNVTQEWIHAPSTFMDLTRCMSIGTKEPTKLRKGLDTIWALKPWKQILLDRIAMDNPSYYPQPPWAKFDLAPYSDIELVYDDCRRCIREFAIRYVKDENLQLDGNIDGGLLDMETSRKEYVNFMSQMSRSKAKSAMNALAQLVLCAFGVLSSPRTRPCVALLSEYILVHCSLLCWRGVELSCIRRLFAETVISLHSHKPWLVNTWNSIEAQMENTDCLFLWISPFLRRIEDSLNGGDACDRARSSFQFTLGVYVIDCLFMSDGSKGIRKALQSVAGVSKSLLHVSHHPMVIAFTLENGVLRTRLSTEQLRIKVYLMLTPELLLTNAFDDRDISYSMIFRHIVNDILAPPQPDETLSNIIVRIFSATFMITRMTPFSWPDILCENHRASLPMEGDNKIVPFCVCRKCVALKSRQLVIAVLLDKHILTLWNGLPSDDRENALSLIIFSLFRSVLWCEYGRKGPHAANFASKDNIVNDSVECIRRWKRLVEDHCPSLIDAPSVIYWGSSVLAVTSMESQQPTSKFTRLPLSLVKQYCVEVHCNSCGKRNIGSEGMRLCGGCMTTSYCSVKCHDIGWLAGHRRTCSSLSPKRLVNHRIE